MILVFDLDDTLYNEINYVKSGFQEVAVYVGAKHKLCEKELFLRMLENLNTNGRGRVFDDMLISYGIFSKKLANKCISVYRMHHPNIHLNQDAIDCISRFEKINKYIVTDGNKVVQQLKINALKIQPYFKKCFITHRYGIKNSKPSSYCFKKISALENQPYDNIVYVGDNPTKDFIQIKKLGFKTVQILQGPYKNIELSEEYYAHRKIHSLSELTKDLIDDIKI